MAACSTLTDRMGAYFYGPFLRVGKDFSLTIQRGNYPPKVKQFRFEIVTKAFAKQLTSDYHKQWGQTGEPFSGLDTLANSAFTKQVYIFTDSLVIKRDAVAEALALQGMKAVIIDDTEWSERNNRRQCDVFLSHDSRDKERFVRDLHIELVKRHIKVWYDEATLKPGDQIGASIDKGLTECRHGVIVLSPNLLGNQGWGQAEISALLTRAATTKQIIVPVWLDVTREQVAAQSARLADLLAIVDQHDPPTVADKIVTAIGGPKGLRRRN